jgi:single-strand DNA-binding protein
MNVNKCIIIGRLTKAPEIRTTQTGQSTASLSVATSRAWKDKQGQKQEKSSFHNIVMWGRLAEIAGQYLTKGQEIFIEGRIETRSWDDKGGNKHYITEIIAENMQMGAKTKGQEQVRPVAQSATAAEEIPTISHNEDEVLIEDVPF